MKIQGRPAGSLPKREAAEAARSRRRARVVEVDRVDLRPAFSVSGKSTQTVFELALVLQRRRAEQDLVDVRFAYRSSWMRVSSLSIRKRIVFLPLIDLRCRDRRGRRGGRRAGRCWRGTGRTRRAGRRRASAPPLVPKRTPPRSVPPEAVRCASPQHTPEPPSIHRAPHPPEPSPHPPSLTSTGAPWPRWSLPSPGSRIHRPLRICVSSGFRLTSS